MKTTLITLFCFIVFPLHGEDSGIDRDDPGSLFAIMAPGALVQTNANGYSLLQAGGKYTDVRRVGRSYEFTDVQSRKTIQARRDSSGWTLYDGTKIIGRVSLVLGGAHAQMGEELRQTTKTSDGYTTAVSSNSAQLYFQHMYRRDEVRSRGMKRKTQDGKTEDGK